MTATSNFRKIIFNNLNTDTKLNLKWSSYDFILNCTRTVVVQMSPEGEIRVLLYMPI